MIFNKQPHQKHISLGGFNQACHTESLQNSSKQTVNMVQRTFD
jgi:hypothetical protein